MVYSRRILITELLKTRTLLKSHFLLNYEKDNNETLNLSILKGNHFKFTDRNVFP